MPATFKTATWILCLAAATTVSTNYNNSTRTNDRRREPNTAEFYDEINSAASVSSPDTHNANINGGVKKLKGEFLSKFAYVSMSNAGQYGVVSSPISALLPLGKFALGSKGATFKELSRAIGVKTRTEVVAHFKKIIKDLAKLPGVTLSIASSIYVNKGKELKEEFQNKCAKVFGSTVSFVDFSRKYDALKEINRWVAAQTHGKIRELVSPDDVQQDTSIILVNAVYFTGRWLHPFQVIEPGNFMSPRGNKKVTMMLSSEYYKYYQSPSLDAQIISIPYEGDDAKMVVLLPKRSNGLPTLINQLKMAPELLDHALKQLKEEMVDLTIPKFHLETRFDLKDLYIRLGLQNIFSRDSGLQEMVRNERLIVSSAVQKAYIDVNEWGTKAAAGSATSQMKISLNLDTKTFLADRPFMFFVMGKHHQLFSGAVYDP